MKSNGFARFEKSLLNLLSYTMSEEKAQICLDNLTDSLGLGAIFRCSSLDELESVKGVNKNTAAMLKLVGALYSRSITEKLTPGKKYSDYEIDKWLIGAYIGFTLESIYMLSFDENDRFIGADMLGEGTEVSSDTYPRKLLAISVKRGAKKVILAHNHPRSSVLPSEQDIVSTRRLYDILASGGITLVCHCVVCDYSLYRINPTEDYSTAPLPGE